MSAKQSASKRQQWREGKYRNRKQVRAEWAVVTAWNWTIFQRNPTALNRIAWAIARDQLRSD